MILYHNKMKHLNTEKIITIWKSRTLLGIHIYELETPDTW
jgi:hypothetical protein